MTSDLDDPLLGRTLGGRFRVDRALKRGGMGAVYRGHDLQDGVDVAIKVVKQTLADDPEAIARFKREIRLMAEVQDAHIVRSIDAGDADGVLWIAMELLDGLSLRERIDSRGRWPWAETLPVVRQIALALGAAHDKGVIHRDLKPENIMLADVGAGAQQVKLLDFGVAKQSRAADAAATHMTGTGLLVGTPGYVAPEVVLEGTVDDPRSDFYALGVTWFELLTGQKPFSAKTPMALALRHAHEVPPTPSSLLPFAPVPGPVEQLVMRLLEKNPEARPAGAADLVAAIDRLKDAAEQANTPVSTIKDLSPSESTVTSMETPGTQVARLLLDASRSSSSSSSLPAPPVPAIPERTRGAFGRPQQVAAGVALIVVVVVGALWSTRQERRRPRRDVFSAIASTHAAPAPLKSDVQQPAPGPIAALPTGGQATVDRPTGTVVGIEEPPQRVIPNIPATANKVDRPRRVRKEKEAPVSAGPRLCTIGAEGTGSAWQVHEDGRWADLPKKLSLVPGSRHLEFREPVTLVVRRVPFEVPGSGSCTHIWKGP